VAIELVDSASSMVWEIFGCDYAVSFSVITFVAQATRCEVPFVVRGRLEKVKE